MIRATTAWLRARILHCFAEDCLEPHACLGWHKKKKDCPLNIRLETINNNPQDEVRKESENHRVDTGSSNVSQR